jgi:hypothetical protein
MLTYNPKMAERSESLDKKRETKYRKNRLFCSVGEQVMDRIRQETDTCENDISEIVKQALKLRWTMKALAENRIVLATEDANGKLVKIGRLSSFLNP